jgi:hypothetical protein
MMVNPNDVDVANVEAGVVVIHVPADLEGRAVLHLPYDAPSHDHTAVVEFERVVVAAQETVLDETSASQADTIGAEPPAEELDVADRAVFAAEQNIVVGRFHDGDAFHGDAGAGRIGFEGVRDRIGVRWVCREMTAAQDSASADRYA